MGGRARAGSGPRREIAEPGREDLSREDALRLNVLLHSNPVAIRIDESAMVVHGLSERGEAKLPLNPNCRDDLYLRRVRELISGHVLGGDKGKLSKSKGGAAITPENLLKNYPADAIRFSSFPQAAITHMSIPFSGVIGGGISRSLNCS